MTRIAIIVGAILITLPVSAFAQEETSASRDDARARELYLRGDRLYTEGQYEEAIALFVEAYEISGRAELQFNLANAYERAGRVEQAIAALREYAPHAPAYDHDTIARRIRALEDRLTATPEIGSRGEMTPESGPDDSPPPTPSDSRTSAVSGRTDRQGNDSDGLLIGGAILLGLGVAAGSIGLGLALAKQGATDEAAGLCDGGVCTEAVREILDRESSMALGADLSFAIAGGLALTGLILIAVGATSGRDDEDAVRVRAMVGPTLGGVNVSASF